MYMGVSMFKDLKVTVNLSLNIVVSGFVGKYVDKGLERKKLKLQLLSIVVCIMTVYSN